jgi:hypothetical protein
MFFGRHKEQGRGQLSDAMATVEATTGATPTGWSSRTATAVEGGT